MPQNMMWRNNALRNVLAAMLLAGAWLILQHWYYSRHPWTYAAFLACALPGALLASIGTLRNLMRNARRGRLAAAAVILFLCLPWGEWIGLSLPSSRKDWTRILFIQFSFLFALSLAWQFVPGVRRLTVSLSRTLEKASRSRLALFVPALLFFAATLAIAYLVYDTTPVIQDSAAHLFQAEIFLNGEWFAPAPPAAESFEHQGDMLVIHDGRWFAMYLPGFAVLLAAAMSIQAEWIFCPMLGAATVAIWIEFARRWYGRKTAFYTGLLCLLSPFLLCMSSTIMIHTPELFLDSAAIYLCRRESESPSGKNRWLLALVIFIGVITRGFSILIFLLPPLLYLSWRTLLDRKRALFPTLLIAALAGAAFVLIFQDKTTGSPWVPGYNLEYKRPHALGFGENIAGLTHTPLKGMEQVSNNILGLNHWLTGWYSGSLFLLFLFLMRQDSYDTWEKILLASCACLILFYYFYVIQDLVFGPRFLYPLAPILLLFMARSLSRTDSYGQKALFTAFVSMLSFLPARLPEFVRHYDPTAKQPGALARELDKNYRRKLLVFLDPHTSQDFTNRNDPFLRKGIIICRDLAQEQNAKAQKVFAQHTPVHFRLGVSMEKGNLKTNYSFQAEPDPNPRGYLSLFDFANAMQTANDLDEDYFDIAYSDIFTKGDSYGMLSYLKSIDAERPGEAEYKTQFRKGLIHAARLAILPAQASELHHADWRSHVDTSAFQGEYTAAREAMERAGETGRPLLKQLQEIGVRIDRNSDGEFSDTEITRFLWTKRYLLMLA